MKKGALKRATFSLKKRPPLSLYSKVSSSREVAMKTAVAGLMAISILLQNVAGFSEKKGKLFNKFLSRTSLL